MRDDVKGCLLLGLRALKMMTTVSSLKSGVDSRAGIYFLFCRTVNFFYINV